MTQTREIELKFVIDPDTVDAFLTHPLLGGAPVDAKRTASIYYDTPDGNLRKAGVTLRVRRSGDAMLQTIKADGRGAAGLFDRAEWEAPIARLEPDLGLVAGTAADEALRDEETRAALTPMFETVVERRRWDILSEGSEIELILDQGELVAGARRQPLAEVEMELKRGAQTALFDLARVLSLAAPLKIGVLTKSEQGYRLARGKTSPVQKAEAVVVDPEMSAGEGFAQIAGACVRHFRLNEPGLLLARDGEALHQARVALRRLRSAFSIFRPVVADEAGDALRGELGRLSRVLGGARDLDVFIAKRLGGADDAVRLRVMAERERAYDEALVALDALRFRGVMIDLVAWIADGEWRDAKAADQPLPEFAASALDRFWRRVKKDGRDLAKLDDEARHEVRIAGKKLRYAAEFFEALTTGKKRGRRRDAFMSALGTLQEHLGDLNDLATARELTLSLSAKVGADLGGHDDGRPEVSRKKLLASAERAHAELVDAGPFWR